MRSAAPWRSGMLAVAVLLAMFAGWRVFGLMQADAALARDDVAGALRWRADHPAALLAQAEAQLGAGQPQAAAATARRLLQADPMQGRAYRVLAQVAGAEGRKDAARSLYRIAVRRAPDDLPARAWLAQDALERGEPAEALVQIDHVLTLSPGAGANVFPILLKLSADPAFAQALAGVLRRPPAWRAGMLAALQQAKEEDRAAADQVLAALQATGGLDAAETAAGIEALLQQGRWSQAYARWASPFVQGGKPLPLLFNGDFAQEPSGTGFDWRLPATAGVITSFEPDRGGGRALHARFLGRRVAGALLEHRLWLAPGRYHLEYRVRSEALRSDAGVGWTLVCEGRPEPLGRGAPLDGSRGWRNASLVFTVPAEGCPGQWLRLGNAVNPAAGQIVGGDLWLATVALRGQAAPGEKNSQAVAASP